jgi:hypothetical protein
MARQTTTKSKLNVDGILARMSDSREPVFEDASTWHSHRVQVLKGGQWVHPPYLPVYKSRNEAFKAAIVGFPLGQARVVLMKFINDDLMEVVEAPQKEFLWHCLKWGKI